MSAFKLMFSKPVLDKLRRLKRVPAESLFPELPPEHLDRLNGVAEGRPATIWDEKTEGLCVLVAAGTRPECRVTFRACFYLKDRPGVPRYQAIGRYPSPIDDVAVARKAAAQIRAKAHNAPDRRSTVTVDAMLKRYLDEHVDTLRSRDEVARILLTYVLPEWRGRPIEGIRKADIAELLSKIRAGKIRRGDRYVGTASSARAAFAQISALLNWFEQFASDSYVVPISRNQRKQLNRGRAPARSRVLSDDEIRALWKACEATGTMFTRSVQMGLLTGQRFRKVARMEWADVHGEWKHNGTALANVWDPTDVDDAENKQASLVPLSTQAVSILRKVPVINASPFVFSESGQRAFSGWSRAKRQLDARIRDAGLDLPPWQLRDLRRTARTLMSRAGVEVGIAELCLGHVLTGVRAVYDRHDFAMEKAAAFQKLGDLVQDIVGAKSRRLPLKRKR